MTRVENLFNFNCNPCFNTNFHFDNLYDDDDSVNTKYPKPLYYNQEE